MAPGGAAGKPTDEKAGPRYVTWTLSVAPADRQGQRAVQIACPIDRYSRKTPVAWLYQAAANALRCDVSRLDLRDHMGSFARRRCTHLTRTRTATGEVMAKDDEFLFLEDVLPEEYIAANFQIPARIRSCKGAVHATH